LLVLGGPHVDLDALEATLGRHFRLVVSTPSSALTTMETEGCQAVLAEAGDFVPLERDLVGRQSSALLNAIGEGVCLVNGAGRVLWSNVMYREFPTKVRQRIEKACAHAAGYYARRVTDALGMDDRTRRLRPRKYKIDMARTERFFEVLVSPVASRAEELVDGRAAVGATTGPVDIRGILVAAVVRDVTSAVRMERKIDAIDRAGRELAHLEAEAIRKLHAAERLKLLEQRVIRFAHELLHFDHFAIRMVNPNKDGRLDVVLACGMPEEAKSIQLFARAEGNGISGMVAATGESYISNDTTRDPRYVFGLNEPGSSLTVPLRLFDKVIGVFNIESSERFAFNDNDRKFAEIFAGSVAQALHMLNLLLVERHTTNQAATGTVSGEIASPLNDLAEEVNFLRSRLGSDVAMAPHLDRIVRDVASIRKRIQNVSRGPQMMLGADDFIERAVADEVLRGKRILVADNEEPIRDAVRDVLSVAGCRVVTCDDGTSAIRLLETWRATFDEDEGYDLVLSDINLGDVTGYDVFHAARRASATLPVILMTGFGYDPHHSIVRATQEGLRGVLFKPFQAERLVEEVRNVFVGPTGG
jgi:CheY-like chemotaxis protein/GAF domain-containing protein